MSLQKPGPPIKNSGELLKVTFAKNYRQQFIAHFCIKLGTIYGQSLNLKRIRTLHLSFQPEE